MLLGSTELQGTPTEQPKAEGSQLEHTAATQPRAEVRQKTLCNTMFIVGRERRQQKEVVKRDQKFFC